MPGPHEPPLNLCPRLPGRLGGCWSSPGLAGPSRGHPVLSVLLAPASPHGGGVLPAARPLLSLALPPPLNSLPSLVGFSPRDAPEPISPCPQHAPTPPLCKAPSPRTASSPHPTREPPPQPTHPPTSMPPCRVPRPPFTPQPRPSPPLPRRPPGRAAPAHLEPVGVQQVAPQEEPDESPEQPRPR